MSQAVPCRLFSVFLLTENRLLREALVRILSKRSDVTVVGALAFARLFWIEWQPVSRSRIDGLSSACFSRSLSGGQHPSDFGDGRDRDDRNGAG